LRSGTYSSYKIILLPNGGGVSQGTTGVWRRLSQHQTTRLSAREFSLTLCQQGCLFCCNWRKLSGTAASYRDGFSEARNRRWGPACQRCIVVFSITAGIVACFRYSCFSTGLDRLLGLQEFEAFRIPRQSTPESGTVVIVTHRPPLSP
jgi:hypothetical protein